MAQCSVFVAGLLPPQLDVPSHHIPSRPGRHRRMFIRSKYLCLIARLGQPILYHSKLTFPASGLTVYPILPECDHQHFEYAEGVCVESLRRYLSYENDAFNRHQLIMNSEQSSAINRFNVPSLRGADIHLVIHCVYCWKCCGDSALDM